MCFTYIKSSNPHKTTERSNPSTLPPEPMLLTTTYSVSTGHGWQKRVQFHMQAGKLCKFFLINAASEHSTAMPRVAFLVLGMSRPWPHDEICVWETHTCCTDKITGIRKARMVRRFHHIHHILLRSLSLPLSSMGKRVCRFLSVCHRPGCGRVITGIFLN